MFAGSCLTVIELEKVACLILIFFFPLMNFSHCNFTERFTSAGKKKKMPRKPCPEFLYYSKRSLIPKRAAFIFVTCCKLEFIHLYPATTTPAKSRVFGGAFYLSPKLLIPIFFGIPREGKGLALSASLGWVPRQSPAFGEGVPAWGAPPCPRCPLPGGRYCVRGAGLRQNNGRGGLGWGKKGEKTGKKAGKKGGGRSPSRLGAPERGLTAMV